MNLPENTQKVFNEEIALQRKAYEIIIDIVKSHNNELGVIAYTTFDFNSGCISSQAVSVRAILIRENKLVIVAKDLETEEVYKFELPVLQSTELLHLLKKATISDSGYFFFKFPKVELLKTDDNIEKAFILFYEVPIDDNDNLTDDFMDWNKGTSKDTVWNWFDTHHSRGITYLQTLI